jgi:hypothetical protein
MSQTNTAEIAQTIRSLESEWKRICPVLDRHEKALVETYLRFMRTVARARLEKGCRIWFLENRWTHWGEGGFGSLSVLLPAGKGKPQADLPTGIQLLTNLSDKRRLGEEITLATLDRITYEPDGWL